MRAILTPFLVLPLSLLAQTTWPVQVGGSVGSANPPFYSPQNLTIEVGDIVQWTNVSGTHNVNGTTALFPGNPQSFTSGSPQSGGWNFSHTFTIPGVYNYHCTQGGHSATQFGQITVTSGTSVNEIEGSAEVNLFPVPTGDVLTVELGQVVIRTAEVFSIDGQRVLVYGVNGATRVDIPVGGLAAGQYFLRLMDEKGRAITRPFRKV
jgi:plastocyanin